MADQRGEGRAYKKLSARKGLRHCLGWRDDERLEMFEFPS